MSKYVKLSHYAVHLKLAQHSSIYTSIKKNPQVCRSIRCTRCDVSTLSETFRTILIVFAETDKSLVISKCHVISQTTNNREEPGCHLSEAVPSPAHM